MAKGIRVELNGRAMGELLKSDDVRSELTKRAESVLSQARATAPVDTGAYRDSLHVAQDSTAHRATVKVVSDADHAPIVEVRTGNLARALDAGR